LANLALILLFRAGMVLSGVRAYNGDQTEHGEPTVSVLATCRPPDNSDSALRC
jgi:hypothetical protein